MKYKNIIILFIIFLISDVIHAQKPNYDSLTVKKQKITLAFLDLKEGDAIADIGTNSGYSIVPIANEYPKIKFTVEDIDSNSCNIKTLSKRIKKLGNKTSIEQFSFIYGTETSTNLPTSNFNKVLMFMVLHEMTFKKEMLADIKRILQKNGSLFIQENISHKPQKKQRACNYRFLTENEFKQIMTENKFLLKREQISFDTGHNTYLKLSEYTVAE